MTPSELSAANTALVAEGNTLSEMESYLAQARALVGLSGYSLGAAPIAWAFVGILIAYLGIRFFETYNDHIKNQADAELKTSEASLYRTAADKMRAGTLTPADAAAIAAAAANGNRPPDNSASVVRWILLGGAVVAGLLVATRR